MSIVMSQKVQPIKRKRGVLISPRGWQRLQIAEQQASDAAGHTGRTHTLQELSEMTGLSANTLARVRGRRIPVDQQTLDTYFRAFNLTLHSDDFTDSDSLSLQGRQPVPPTGQLPLDSRYYIERPPVESLCLDGILQLGGLVRIKSPRQSGKTSLVARTLLQVREQQGYETVILNLRLADSDTLRNLQRFLQWFCAVVGNSLGLENQIEKYWDSLFGASYNCTHYFESYLLQHLEGPLVLAIDDVDTVFDYPELATDFFGMLRAWYEKARYGDSSSELWQRLRLVMVHSTEVYVPLSVAQSPFNAGLLIELPGLTSAQVLTLARQYGVEDIANVTPALMKLVGDRPHLLHLGLYHLGISGMAIDDLINNALTGASIYSSHLRNQLWDLQKHPELLTALKQMVDAKAAIELPPLIAYKLQSRGLAILEQGKIKPSCDLYRTYFRQSLTQLTP
jgi:hypothetical protein